MDENKEPKPSGPRRFWTVYNALIMFLAGSATLVGTKAYDRFTEERPLYEAFQTKSEAALVVSALSEVRTELGNVKTALVDVRKYMDERRTARDQESKEIRAEQTSMKLEIANLKLLMSGKVKLNN